MSAWCWVGPVATLGLAFTFAAQTPARAAGAEPRLRAGAAAVSITPSLERPVYLAGFNANRPATSIHDPVMARVLVLELGRERVALVGLDLIGLPNHRIRAIRRRVRTVPADRIVISCTHVHSGPDTLGLWGPSPTETGRDPRYMERMEEQVAQAIDKAAASLKPATIRFAQATVPDGLAYNSRERGLQDRTLTALQATGRDGTIATLVNYACHPEVMQNGSNALTADFCGVTMQAVERAFGGVSIYLNGALGGMVTPEARKNEWTEVERVGNGIAATAIEALKKAEPARIDRLRVQRREVTLPLDNDRFRAALAAGLLEMPAPARAAAAAAGGDAPAQSPTSITTEVTHIELGEAEFVTVPGELLPRPGLELRAAMRAKYRFLIGLGEDELGYILDPADFPRDLYRYERSMSVGPKTWPLLFDALKTLIGRGHPTPPEQRGASR